jgi:hypothetical protein
VKKEEITEQCVVAFESVKSREMEGIKAYIEHVYNGGDQSKAVTPEGEFQSFYQNPTTSRYALDIVNAYRTERGEVSNIFHPSTLQFRLFDKLLEGWVGAKFGMHRTSSLMDSSTLKRNGYRLIERVTQGRKQFHIEPAPVDE